MIFIYLLISLYLSSYLISEINLVFPECLAYRNGIGPTFEAKTHKGKSPGGLLGKTFFPWWKAKTLLSPWLSSVFYEDMMLGTFAATLWLWGEGHDTCNEPSALTLWICWATYVSGISTSKLLIKWTVNVFMVHTKLVLQLAGKSIPSDE